MSLPVKVSVTFCADADPLGLAELAVIVGVVAVRAKDAGAHRATGCRAIDLQYLRQQTGLWKHAAAIVCDWMAGGCGQSELGNKIQRIACGHQACRQVSIELCVDGFARACPMASQAILKLTDCRIDDGRSIHRTHAFRADL